jgi:hypothetical protein
MFFSAAVHCKRASAQFDAPEMEKGGLPGRLRP